MGNYQTMIDELRCRMERSVNGWVTVPEAVLCAVADGLEKTTEERDDLELERNTLKARLEHLLLSNTVSRYDALNHCGGYVLDISELDNQLEERIALMKEVAELRGVRDSIKVAMPDPEVFYICDRRACNRCNEECKHTQDIRHAKSFEVSALGGFWEQEG